MKIGTHIIPDDLAYMVEKAIYGTVKPGEFSARTRDVLTEAIKQNPTKPEVAVDNFLATVPRNYPPVRSEIAVGVRRRAGDVLPQLRR